MIDFKKIAIVVLCYSDYESLEISLALYSKLTNPDVDIYLLQNGRGTYDTERTYRVCKRYEKLFPKNIHVVDWIKPGVPHHSIYALLKSELFKKYDYICKVDDDVFPLTSDWVEKLAVCFEDAMQKYGDKLAYVTSLINNNPWGFKQVVDIMGLQEDFNKISLDHYIGIKGDSDSARYRFVPKSEIHPGGGGSVWALPHYGRWIHKHTTLLPDDYISATRNLGYEEVDNTERYSINCMFFRKNFWFELKLYENSCDEYEIYSHCKEFDKKIIADLSIPMVHLLYYTQREENRDLIPIIRERYEERLNLPFPISMSPNRNYEIENRMRWSESKFSEGVMIVRRTPFLGLIFGKLYYRIKYELYKVMSTFTVGKLRKYFIGKKYKYKELI